MYIACVEQHHIDQTPPATPKMLYTACAQTSNRSCLLYNKVLNIRIARISTFAPRRLHYIVARSKKKRGGGGTGSVAAVLKDANADAEEEEEETMKESEL